MESQVKKGDKLDLVVFSEHYAVGKAHDPNRSLTSGQTVSGVPVELTYYNETFFCVKFKGRTATEQYNQYIPWSQCTGVFESYKNDK
jgi:hypothetical protein